MRIIVLNYPVTFVSGSARCSLALCLFSYFPNMFPRSGSQDPTLFQTLLLNINMTNCLFTLSSTDHLTRQTLESDLNSPCDMNQLNRNTCLAFICVISGIISLICLRSGHYQNSMDKSAIMPIIQSLDAIRNLILAERSSSICGKPNNQNPEDAKYSITLPVNQSYDDNFDHYSDIEITRLSDRIKRLGINCIVNAFPDVVGLRLLWRPGEYLKDYKSIHDPHDHRRIIKLIKGCSLPMDSAFLKARPQPLLYAFEKRYLSHPPLSLTELASSSETSEARLLNNTDDLTVGDTLCVMVNVHNSKGEIMSRGGDEIRVWFIDFDDETRFAADVSDLNNGSYLATARLPSAGNFTVRVALAHSSDFLGAVVRLHLLFKSLLWNVGLFKHINGTESESTLCSHQPNLPLYKVDELCNLTNVNGFPWYCGRPATPTLSCNQYLGTKNIQHIAGWRLPVSDAQLKELERTNEDPKIRLIKLDDRDTLTVKENTVPQTRNIPCNRVPGRRTWTQTSSGYLQNHKWMPNSCSIPEADIVAPEKCLKDRDIYIFADSNGRQMHWEICDNLMNATEVFGTDHVGGWHKPIKCVNKQLNFSSLWRPHSAPWCHSQEKWAILMNPGDNVSERTSDPLLTDDPRGMVNQLNPSAAFIDDLPSKGRLILILHHYFHFTMHHFSGYHNMVVILRDAVRRLVRRNPEALVVVRGPHAAYVGWPGAHYVGGDMLARFFEEILIREFRNISNRVIYIRMWDLTVAIENFGVHPRDWVQEAYVKTILNYVCGRI